MLCRHGRGTNFLVSQQMNQKQWIDLADKVLAKNYGRFPVVFSRGNGTKLYDAEDKEYLDFVSGLAVNNLGHCPPIVVHAINRQAEKLLHVSNLYHVKPQIELADLLVRHSFGDRVFFCNSGTEANEAAFKLARRYFYDKGKPEKNEFITMKNSFHGRTFASLTATGQEKFHEGFSPLVPGFHYVPFNDIGAIEKAISHNTCAVMVEPIQGEGGVNIPDTGYLKALRRLCDEKEILLIFDEVQVGLGRTGTLFAYQGEEVEPDIMTLAKSLAGGVAIGALIAKEDVIQSFVPGTHAATFGGNPLACAAGVAAFKELSKEETLSHCKEMGNFFMERLSGLKDEIAGIESVRGRGLIIAMDISVSAKDIVVKCMEKGVLINNIKETTLRFLPPLIVQKEEIDMVCDTLREVMGS